MTTKQWDPLAVPRELVQRGYITEAEWVDAVRAYHGFGPLQPKVEAKAHDPFQDAKDWGWALNEAAWVFTEACPEKSALLFNNAKASIRAAILKYAEEVEKAARHASGNESY